MLERIRQFVAEMPRSAKIALVAVVVVGAAAAVYYWAANYSKQADYEALFSNLDPKDASEIVQSLAQRRIGYKLAAGGSTILVPSADVHEARLAIAGEGLPRGGVVGFELMDATSFGATDFDRRVNYLRALTGELTRTIQKIDGVEDARVHIVLPEDSYFVTRTRPATAAVFLKLRPMTELQRSQIKGIIHLVSRSVEGLSPDDVAVVDLYGRLLSGDGNNGAGGAQSSANLTAQNDFQKDLEISLQALLERVLGPGNVVARVSAELSFDQKTVETLLYQPTDDGIVRSMQQLEESFRGEGISSAGVPGTTSNIPQYQAGSGAGASESERRETVSNFEISEIKETTVVAPGSVKRLSVAVMVNKDIGDANRVALKETVEAAIGVDPERRDVVSVVTMPFDNTLLDEIKNQMESDAPPDKTQFGLALSPLALYSAAGVATLLLAVLVFVIVRRRRRRREREYELMASEDNIEHALQAAAEQAAEQARAKAKEPDPETERRKQLREEVEQVARLKPETVAEMIRAWMTEDRR